MNARTLNYVGGSGEILYVPLSDGRVSFESGVPIVITDERDYLRLMSSGKYVDVTPEPVAEVQAVAANMSAASVTPAPAKPTTVFNQPIKVNDIKPADAVSAEEGE